MSDPTQPHAPSATGPDADSAGHLDATVPRAAGAPLFAAPARAGELGTLGRYRVLQELGKGGMGAVYLGHDDALDRKLALKVMLPSAAADATARERFLREARTAAKVKSDHVVTIHDVGEANGTPFIAMEYLLGAPLDLYLKKKGELPLGQAVRIARECALGLAAVHEMGLVHRDIKPGNVWLEAPNGRVKLLDFGLARGTADDVHITGSGAVVGTVAYMSPEQGKGEKVDHRTDLWSLGVMLYRLCTGRMPFEGESAMVVLTGIAVHAPTAPRALSAAVPPALEAVILKLLEKDRGARFQTAREVVAALLVIERGDVPQVVAVPVPQPMQVGAQTQNVWESIAADSESVAVPLAERDATEAEVAPARAEPRRASKLPLLLGAGVLLAALAGLVVAVLWAGKTPDVAKKDDEQPPPPAPKEPKKPPEQKPKDKSPDPQPDSPEGKVYPVPANLIGSMTPLKPEKVFSLDWLDPAKHVPAAERYDWQPKELVALLGSHRQRAPNGGLQWVRVSPDGAFALAGGFGLSWKFDLNTGRVSDGPPVGVVSADFRRGASGNKVFDLTDPKAGPVVYSSLGEVRAFLNDELVLAFRDSIYAIRKLDGKGGADVVDSFTQLEVRQFAVSPDAKYLALVMKDESCRVYDLAAGFNKNKFAELPGPEGRTLPFAVTFSYTGRMSVFGRSGDASVGRVWDVSRAPPALVSSGPHGTLTGDGKFLFGGGNESFDVFAVGSNAKPLASGQLHGVGGYFSGGVSSSRDGATTVTAQGGGAIRVWELKPGVLNERNPIRPQTLLSLNSAVSPDGRFAVVREEGTSGAAGVLLNLTDLAARELTVVGDAVGFGPDGSALYTSGAGSSVRRAPDFAPVPAFAPDVTPLCFSPDGKWMVGTSKTELHVWDVSAAQPKRLWAVPGIEAPRAHFTPDGRFLIARNGSTPHPGKVRVWALTATGPKLRYETDTFAGKSWDALSPDGRTLAVCEYAGHSCQLCLYDIELGVPKGRRVLAADLKPAVVEFSTDGRSLLVFDSNLKVLDAGTGAVLYQPPLRGAPHGARFHPDGKHVFVTNADSTTYVLRLPKDVLEKVAGDADRRAIEWVLSVGGIVYAEGDARQLKRADELPAGPFRYHVVLEHNTNIRPEALAVFRDARNLSGFNAHSSNVTDAGLAHLSGAKKLIWLHLNDTAISDAGLKHLEGLQALRQLSLKNTTVTEPALKALKLKLHPDCLIEWDKGAVKP